jgi:hypothetical protein
MEFQVWGLGLGFWGVRFEDVVFGFCFCFLNGRLGLGAWGLGFGV